MQHCKSPAVVSAQRAESVLWRQFFNLVVVCMQMWMSLPKSKVPFPSRGQPSVRFQWFLNTYHTLGTLLYSQNAQNLPNKGEPFSKYSDIYIPHLLLAAPADYQPHPTDLSMILVIIKATTYNSPSPVFFHIYMPKLELLLDLLHNR